ncbi:MAG: aldehyde dehydrogenase family protein [Parvularculaceae bacterium]
MNAVMSLSALKTKMGAAIPERIGSIINGAHRLDESPESWDILYPATEEPVTRVIGASDVMVDEAAAVARRAFESGPWTAMSHDERKKIFFKIADAIDGAADDLAFLQTVETGLPYKQLRARHAARAAENFRFFAEIASGLSGETYTQTGTHLSLTLHEPIGVGLVISPWNAPLPLASMKAAACLILGNSCIIKPSEYAPLALFRMVEIMHEAGLPADALQFINGGGATAGARLTAHPDIDAINFVGGTQTGRRIMANAASGIKKVGLELGGKSANIIFETANFERALDAAMLAIFSGNGQQCLAGSRILVQSSIAEKFNAAFVQRAKNLRIGDPFDPATEIGPIIFKAHRDRILDYAGKAATDGDQILAGGNKASGFDKGYFIEPTVVLARSNKSRVCQEEIFGPFATLQTFDTIEDAIAIANDSDFGLVSYVWSDDLPTATRMMRAIRAGTVWINTPMARDLRAPFGGYKQSGIGRDGIPGSIELFSEQKTVMLPMSNAPIAKLGSAD